MGALIRAVLNIFLSMLVGAFALALCAYYYPEWLESFQIQASKLKDWILETMKSAGSTSSINVWLRFLVQDEQLVFMGFVIAARVGLFLLLSLLGTLFFGAFRDDRLDEERQALESERQQLEADWRTLNEERRRFDTERRHGAGITGGSVGQLG